MGTVRSGRKVPFAIYDQGLVAMVADVILYDDGTGEGVIKASVLERFDAGSPIRFRTRPEIAIWLNTPVSPADEQASWRNSG